MAWNPWRALRARQHIDLHRHPSARLTGGAYCARAGDRAFIVLSPDLDRRERNAALAHELVHLERGDLVDRPDAPDTWKPVAAREEHHVDRIVATRLVPTSELQAAVARWTTMGEAVTAGLVADEFDVPDAVARVALGELERDA